MATTVQSILSSLLTIAGSTLSSGWQELRYVFNIEKNDVRAGYQAYGVRPLEANFASTVINSYMLAHRFELILCSTFTRASSDTEVKTVLSALYDKTDQIYRQFEHTKLNLSPTVASVSDPSISEPEILEGSSLILLRSQLTIRYRHAIP